MGLLIGQSWSYVKDMEILCKQIIIENFLDIIFSDGLKPLHSNNQGVCTGNGGPDNKPPFQFERTRQMTKQSPMTGLAMAFGLGLAALAGAPDAAEATTPGCNTCSGPIVIPPNNGGGTTPTPQEPSQVNPSNNTSVQANPSAAASAAATNHVVANPTATAANNTSVQANPTATGGALTLEKGAITASPVANGGASSAAATIEKGAVVANPVANGGSLHTGDIGSTSAASSAATIEKGAVQVTANPAGGAASANGGSVGDVTPVQTTTVTPTQTVTATPTATANAAPVTTTVGGQMLSIVNQAARNYNQLGAQYDAAVGDCSALIGVGISTGEIVLNPRIVLPVKGCRTDYINAKHTDVMISSGNPALIEVGVNYLAEKDIKWKNANNTALTGKFAMPAAPVAPPQNYVAAPAPMPNFTIVLPPAPVAAPGPDR